ANAVTSAEKYRKQGWLWRGSRNLFLLIRYFGGASPERLAAAYRR
ncbi:MAG: glycosyl transferase, partial [Pseudomonadota bacterium]